MKPTHPICCIFNYPSHYRTNIYKLMESDLDCDFYFGNVDEGKIKKMDYSLFNKPIRELKTIRLFSNFNWIAGSVKLLFKPYQKYILVGDPYCLSTWIILLLNKLIRKKTYLWTHGFYGDEGKAKTWIKKVFFKLSNGVYLYGNHAKELMVEKKILENKLHVIYNSLDYDEQILIRKGLKKSNLYQAHFRNDYPVVIFTGRLTSVKKIEQLIAAHRLLFQKGLRFNVCIVGDGPEFFRLKKITEDYGLSFYYWFYGPCYNEQIIGEFYFNATVCVSPGNVGLTAIHAMTYGCPVITHNRFHDQMPEFEIIEQGFSGDFFEQDNIRSLSETIERWIQKKDLSGVIPNNCYQQVDDKYNPHYQLKVFKETLL